MRSLKAFTLIELLIVVAIIAILAAIAVPNFLEAQVRAKVSRTKADMRTLATGLESYYVDNNRYPFDLDSRGWPWYITDVVSTPIAYVTSASALSDPFREHLKGGTAGPAVTRFRFVNYPANVTPGWVPSPIPGNFTTRWVGEISQPAVMQGMELFGQWKLSSAGPDQTANSGFIAGDLIYDPTNGTISDGDIIRSQKGGQS